MNYYYSYSYCYCWNLYHIMIVIFYLFSYHLNQMNYTPNYQQHIPNTLNAIFHMIQIIIHLLYLKFNKYALFSSSLNMAYRQSQVYVFNTSLLIACMVHINCLCRILELLCMSLIEPYDK